jgi:hypothetical protein
MSEIAARNVARKPPAPRLSAARFGLRSNIDIMLAASGVGIALSSLVFAGYMLSDADRPPRIAGMEYLSVFAKPNHSLLAEQGMAPPAAVAAAINLAAKAIDPTPTGSIADKNVSGRPVNLILTPIRDLDARSAASGYKLLDVVNGEALVQSDIGFRHVRIGDTLPDLGRVNAIEKRGDHWVLTTQNGPALEWPAVPASASAETAAPKKKSVQR